MNQVRFASGITTLLAIAMLAGCAKQDAVSTSTEPTPAGDATTAPESDASATTTPSEDSAATPSEAPADAGAAPKN